MTKKILFWIDDSLIHFGIANSLQENLNYQLYSIISVANKKENFFKKQNLVKFKKIWFHNDIPTDQSKSHSVDYLQKFEKEYNIDLWKLIYNDRIFFNFNEFYKFTTNEVLAIVEQEIRLFEKILDEVKPDFICLLPVLRPAYLFYLMCKSRNITPIMLNASRITGKSILNSGDDELGFKKEVVHSSKNHANISLNEFLNQSMQKQVSKESEYWLKPNKKFFLAGLKFLFSDNSSKSTHYAYFGRSKRKVLTNYLYDLFRVRNRKKWLDENAIHKIESKKPFIFFPLHLEQEMSLLIQAPFHTNQLEVIKNLVKSLPMGYELYVKEHPLMYARSWRKISIYKEIMNLPNVKLIHPSVAANELLEKCALVVTISGTTSLDAGFFGKFAIVLSKRPDIPILPHMHQLNNFDELPAVIKKLVNSKSDKNDYFHYIDFLKKNSFDIDFPGLVKRYSDSLFYSGFLTDMEISIGSMKELLAKIKDKNDLIAKKFIEKINDNSVT